MANSKPHFLLVEDSDFDAHVLRYALSHVNVHATLDVVVSVTALKRRLEAGGKLADLVLVDLSLSDGTGFDIIQAIRSSEHTRLVPIIVLSGSDAEDDIRLAYAVGANAYIVKSTEIAYLVHSMRQLNDFWFDVVRLP